MPAQAELDAITEENLDEQEDTNFIVYAEGVQKMPQKEMKISLLR